MREKGGGEKKEEELVCHSLSSFRFESPFSAVFRESSLPTYVKEKKDHRLLQEFV
jgi:hypothetical protein